MAGEEKPAAPQGGRAKMLRTAGVALGVIVLGGVAGYLCVRIVVLPYLAARTVESVVEAADKIPPTATAVNFDKKFVDVVMPDPNMPASLLSYSVTFICANPETQLLVEENRAWFEDMLTKLHQSRPREELTTSKSQVQESIQQVALQRANDLLRRLQAMPDPKIRVIAVLHTDFAVMDQ